jgi:hypothetical protein
MTARGSRPGADRGSWQNGYRVAAMDQPKSPS